MWLHNRKQYQNLIFGDVFATTEVAPERHERLLTMYNHRSVIGDSSNMRVMLLVSVLCFLVCSLLVTMLPPPVRSVTPYSIRARCGSSCDRTALSMKLIANDDNVVGATSYVQAKTTDLQRAYLVMDTAGSVDMSGDIEALVGELIDFIPRSLDEAVVSLHSLLPVHARINHRLWTRYFNDLHLLFVAVGHAEIVLDEYQERLSRPADTLRHRGSVL